ncbi:MAG: DUF1810 family protein [Rhizomicrobium sp.]
MSDDPFNLERFVTAQDPVYARVWSELRAGRKDSHWMWFVFPQLAGLGGSEMSRRYAIRSLNEARAYLKHPVLSDRLRECHAAGAGRARRRRWRDLRIAGRSEIPFVDDAVRLRLQ